MRTSPKFCVFGAGAIGGTIAALLTRCGATVSMVARGQTLAALKRNGLRLVIDGEMLQTPVQVSEDPSELGVQDYVIVAVKAPSLPDIARRIHPLLGPQTVVVTAMNGVPWWFFLNAERRLAGCRLESIDPYGLIAGAIPPSKVVGCVVYIAASVDEPGIIRHHSGRQIVVGEPDNQLTPRLACLADWLRRAGVDCLESADIHRDIWLKLWANLSMNPISLLTTATADRIIDDTLVHELCTSMMQEAAQIGAAIGISDMPPVENMIDKVRSLGAFKMSMLQDVEHRKTVEIDALLTVIHEIGSLVGVATPFIDAVLGLARLRASSLGLLDSEAARDTDLSSPLHAVRSNRAEPLSPTSKGILFDKAHLRAKSIAHDRVEFMGGDFFPSAPRQADAYLLRLVLHDWSDVDAAAILESLRRCMKPTALLIMLVCSGSERTETEYQSLLTGAGFDLEEVVATRSYVNLLVAKPTQSVPDTSENLPGRGEPK
jgi:2-dehydropantoate 2-reductase